MQGESLKVCVCTRRECEGVCVQGESVKVCVYKGRV